MGKAIKKTGQALREDAPEIRPAIDVDGGGSSGDEKKQAKARSPQVGNAQNVIDQQQQKISQVPILPQSQDYNRAQQRGSAPDYQGQVSMPPPNSNNGYFQQNSQQQQQFMQNQQGFETRNIPIQMPLQQQGNQSSFPSQMYNRVQTATNKYGSASKKAMEALNQAGGTIQPQYAPYEGRPEDVAFGIPFHEPSNSRMMSDDVTISTISGLSEPYSSVKYGNSELMNMSLKSSRNTGTSELMNMSLKSGISLTDSLRLRNGHRGNSNHNRAYDPLMPGGHIRSGSRGNDFMGLGGSI